MHYFVWETYSQKLGAFGVSDLKVHDGFVRSLGRILTINPFWTAEESMALLPQKENKLRFKCSDKTLFKRNSKQFVAFYLTACVQHLFLRDTK